MFFRLRKPAWTLVAFAALQAMAGADAYGQDALLRELIRKSEAGEAENGFCATTHWPATDPQKNDAFRDRAALGDRSVDTHKDGTLCSSLLITDVTTQNGQRCLRYTFWVCERGSTCGSGESFRCRNADGAWELRE